MSNVAPDDIEGTRSGKVIALEGDTNVISTQLRLLPLSQKILILPSLLEQLAPESEGDAFNARAFIRDLQKTITQRTETARSFLRSSTRTQPRLVFAVHGSVSARTTCITKISQNVTNGNIEEAEFVFNDLIKDGIAGLVEPEKLTEEEGDETEIVQLEVRDQEQEEEAIQTSDGVSWGAVDPDEQDAALQALPPRAMTPKSRVMDFVRGMEQPKKAGVRSDSRIPVSKFASPTSQHNDEMVRTVPDRKTNLVDRRTTNKANLGSVSLNRHTGGLSHPRQVGTDTDDDSYDPCLVFPGNSGPQTLSGGQYDEACLVDAQTGSPTNSAKRVRSVGKLYSSTAADFQNFSSNAHKLKQAKSHYHLRDNFPDSAAREEYGHDTSRFPTLPRTTFIKGSQTTIRKSPSSTGSSHSWSPSTESAEGAVFVQRGTEGREVPITNSNDVPFVPVFELVEDLVIHFTNDKPNEILESVVLSYKNGSYPIIPSMSSTPMSSETPTASSLSSPLLQDGYEPSISPNLISSMQLEVQSEVRPTSDLTGEANGFRGDRRSFDPYCDESYSPEIKPLAGGHAPPEDMPASPTEVQESEMEKRFVDFSPVNPGNAISVQNSFREFLSILFPAAENYSQYLYPVAPEADRLWKAMFRNEESDPIGIEGRTVDQIIALGCEDGVKKDFFYQISGQVEKVGMKKGGFNRTGKLDIRYLISNVMQGYMSSSVFQQAPSPISDPHFLASLLVPHIEAFLAVNISTRLLILHYSSADLPTIFAIRNLLGKDLFKIAGILDTLASDPPSISRPGTSMSSRPRTPKPINTMESIGARSKARHSLHREFLNSTLRRDSATYSPTTASIQVTSPSISFSKADYLLPSTATDSEIATFLSGIWKVLMEKSTFYTPEPEPIPIIIKRPPLLSTRSADGPRDRDSGIPAPPHQTPRGSKVSRLIGGTATGSIRGSNYAPSISSVTTRGHGNGGGYAASTTSTTAGSKRHKYGASTASDRERKLGDKEWENFYIAEDDSEDDEYDKMILGRGMQKIVPEVKKTEPKANTKKALKWLGLA